VNLQLRPRLLALAPGTRIVSHDWDMGDWLPDETLTIEVPEKSIGREKRSRVHLWRVPAAVHGLWCAPGASMALSQRFQQFSGVVSLRQQATAPEPPWVFDGRLRGTTVELPTLQALQLRWEGGALVLEAPTRNLAAMRFERTTGPHCGV
jgi:hypothetical protein